MCPIRSYATKYVLEFNVYKLIIFYCNYIPYHLRYKLYILIKFKNIYVYIIYIQPNNNHNIAITLNKVDSVECVIKKILRSVSVNMIRGERSPRRVEFIRIIIIHFNTMANNII